MTCIKTGAVVFLLEYNTSIVCDMHKVGECIVMNFTPRAMYANHGREETHGAIVGNGYLNEGKGILVVPADQVNEGSS